MNLTTAEELLTRPKEDGRLFELIRGALVWDMPAGVPHREPVRIKPLPCRQELCNSVLQPEGLPAGFIAGRDTSHRHREPNAESS